MTKNFVHEAHSTPDPDLPEPKPIPVPDDVPAPTNAPVEEPAFPEPPIKAC
jgi:protein TonB